MRFWAEVGLGTLDISGVDLSWELDFCSSQARYMLLAALQHIERATSGVQQMPGSRERWTCCSGLGWGYEHWTSLESIFLGN